MNIFSGATPLILILILLIKTIEVTVGTLRIILINKGYRLVATIFSFVEIMLWVFVASSVISDIGEYPIKGIIYSLGFSLGIYLGSIVESKLAFGKVYIQVIVSENSFEVIAQKLRDMHFGVTVLDAQGMKSKKKVLMVFANRKDKEEIINTVQAIDEKALAVTQDVVLIKGGYVQKQKARQLLK